MTTETNVAEVISLLSAARINPQGFMRRLLTGVTGYLDKSIDPTDDALRVTVRTNMDPEWFDAMKDHLALGWVRNVADPMQFAPLSRASPTGMDGEVELIGLTQVPDDTLVLMSQRKCGLYLIELRGGEHAVPHYVPPVPCEPSRTKRAAPCK